MDRRIVLPPISDDLFAALQDLALRERRSVKAQMVWLLEKGVAEAFGYQPQKQPVTKQGEEA